MNTDLKKYYEDRAAEYEKIYHKPERQNDLAAATPILQGIFSGKEVFEIACGTGFWTEKIADVAASVCAADISQNVIDIAQQKNYTKGNVTIKIADLFQYQPTKKYECLFGGFIWSHIPLQDLDKFITTINNYVVTGGIVVLIDNKFVEGSNLPVVRTDKQGNTYQDRKLDDGSRHLILKNFPDEAYMKNKLKAAAANIRFISLKYYWMAVYETVDSHSQLSK